MKRLLLAALLVVAAAGAYAGGNPSVYPRESYIAVGETIEMHGSTQPGFSPYNYSWVYFWAAPETIAVGSGEVQPGYLTFGTRFWVTGVAPGVATVYYRWASGGADYPAATIYVTPKCPSTGSSMSVAQTELVATLPHSATFRIDTSSLFINVDWFAGRLNQGGTRVQTGPSGEFTPVGLKPGRYYFWANAVDRCGDGLAQRFEFRIDVVLPKRRAR